MPSLDPSLIKPEQVDAVVDRLLVDELQEHNGEFLLQQLERAERLQNARFPKQAMDQAKILRNAVFAIISGAHNQPATSSETLMQMELSGLVDVVSARITLMMEQWQRRSAPSPRAL